MVGLGSVGFLLALWYGWAWLRHRDLPRSRLFFAAASLAGVGSYLAVETGWFTTEVGRQPWIVHGYMRTADAVTTANPAYVWLMFSGLVVVYAALAFFFIALLLRLSARWHRADAVPTEAPPEIGAPYGPRPRTFREPPGGARR
jgi:cytochrome d ubiquinol oxidase subunit I